MNTKMFRTWAALVCVCLVLIACESGEPSESKPNFVSLTGFLSAPASTSGAPAKLAVVALGSNKKTVQGVVQADGSFALKLTKNASYAINVLDENTGTFVASFLFRNGTQTTMALQLTEGGLQLGHCQFVSGEVWCENGFFDAPISGGVVAPAPDLVGTHKLRLDGTGPAKDTIAGLLGGTEVDIAGLKHPTNPFSFAIFNKTRRGCEDALVGTAEAAGNDRFIYTRNTYENPTCRATVTYQAHCTLVNATTCTGFLRVDVASVGTDCSAWPASHGSNLMTLTLGGAASATCSLPQTCTSDLECPSSVCSIDSGFCESAKRPPGLMIYSFDIGQGDSTLVVTPEGKAALIDGGKVAAGRAVASLVRRLVPGIDLMVATHFDNDHVGGMAGIVAGPDGAPGKKGFDDDKNGVKDDVGEYGAAGSDDLMPKVAIDRGTQAASTSADQWFKVLASVRRDAVVGETFNLGNSKLKMTVVCAGGKVLGGTAPALTGDENDRSVGLLIEYGQFSMLTLGDLPGSANRKFEQAVAAGIAAKLPVDVLHASHHGSGESSAPDFLAAVKPKVAIISVGDSDQCGPNYNNYGLPTQDALTNLAAAGVGYVYQTELGGASFGTDCVVAPGQTSPRNYGTMKMQTSYGTLALQTDGSGYRISGLDFEQAFSAQ